MAPDAKEETEDVGLLAPAQLGDIFVCAHGILVGARTRISCLMIAMSIAAHSVVS